MNLLELEKISIGGVIKFPSELKKYVQKISQSSFSNGVHACIWGVIQEAKEINIISISEAMEEKYPNADHGGFSYLAEAAEAAFSKSSAQSALDAVAKFGALTNAKKRMKELIGNKNATLKGAIAEINKISADMSSQLNNEEEYMSHGVSLLSEWSESAYKKMTDKSSRFFTGAEEFDSLFGENGIEEKSLVVIGARPKVGKTSVAAKIIGSMLSTKKKGIFFSLEMTQNQVVESIVGQKLGFRMRSLSDYDEYAKAASKLSNCPLWINVNPNPSFEYIEAQIRAVHEKHGIDFVVIDYLTKMKIHSFGNRTDLAFGQIVQGLKNLAKTLNIRVFLLTQLNRGATEEPDPKDSRETGQIEQEADYWIGLSKNNSATLLKLDLKLNRHGEPRTQYAKLIDGLLCGIGKPFEKKKSIETDF